MTSVTVFVTAPRGCDELGRLFAALNGQLGPSDRLVVLDGSRDGTPPLVTARPSVGRFEHVRATGESAFEMRTRIPKSADRDVTLLFEDHAVPGPNFVAEVRRLFADPEILAVRLLGRNDTSTDPWGWANFLLAFAECLHPAEAPPRAMLSTSAAVRTAALAGAASDVGAWETRTIPGFTRTPHRLAWSNELWVDHLEASDMRLALSRNFYNQRAVAAARVAAGHRRGKLAVRAIKDLALRRPRAIERSVAGRDEHRHAITNFWRIRLICWASTAGAIAGAWFGAGAAMQRMH